MKVSELIEALQKMPQDSEVYVMGNVVECPEKVEEPYLIYTNKLEFYLEDYTYCEEKGEKLGYIHKAVIL